MAGSTRADRDVVEEEERVRPLHRDVVDAHGDQIDADGLVAAGRLGHLSSFVPTPSVEDTSTGSR